MITDKLMGPGSWTIEIPIEYERDPRLTGFHRIRSRRRAHRFAAALVAAFVFLGVFMVLGAPSAAAQQQEPPVDGECGPGFFWATIAGATSCQPLPVDVPADQGPELEGPGDAPADPVVVTSSPATPVVTVCSKHDPITLPESPPWLYGVHWDEASLSGFVFAYLPETHILPNGAREWVASPGGQVFEFTYPAASCEAPVPGAPPAPDPAPGDPPVQLAATGPADTALLITLALAATGIITCGVILTRRRT